MFLPFLLWNFCDRWSTPFVFWQNENVVDIYCRIPTLCFRNKNDFLLSNLIGWWRRLRLLTVSRTSTPIPAPIDCPCWQHWCRNLIRNTGSQSKVVCVWTITTHTHTNLVLMFWTDTHSNHVFPGVFYGDYFRLLNIQSIKINYFFSVTNLANFSYSHRILPQFHVERTGGILQWS